MAVEVSYREAVYLEPATAMIGAPYFEPFEIQILQPEEIVAEKLRALAQRSRPTDLSDLAWLLNSLGDDLDDSVVAEVIAVKFKPGIVQPGPHKDRIIGQIDNLSTSYDLDIPALAPDAHTYTEASRIVRSLIGRVFK